MAIYGVLGISNLALSRLTLGTRRHPSDWTLHGYDERRIDTTII